ncbi:MAG: terminase small subunit [bacterium]
MTSAFSRSVRRADRGAADGAAVALARVYARQIDDGEDLGKLGPQFLQVLDQLGMTPRSRQARRPGETAGTNAAQLETTLAAMAEMGRFERTDSARVQSLRSLARAVDADPGNAALWRQYREALRELSRDGDGSGSLDDEINAMYAEVGDPAPS